MLHEREAMGVVGGGFALVTTDLTKYAAGEYWAPWGQSNSQLVIKYLGTCRSRGTGEVSQAQSRDRATSLVSRRSPSLARFCASVRE
jgi:hypothetical protein